MTALVVLRKEVWTDSQASPGAEESDRGGGRDGQYNPDTGKTGSLHVFPGDQGVCDSRRVGTGRLTNNL